MRNDPPFAVFLTCVLSHLSIFPAMLQLMRRRWLYESSLMIFAIFCSFMYHTCQAFDTTLFLTELQWHRLDNIGALSTFAMLFSYLSVFRDPQFEFYFKISGLFIGVIAQEHSPWNVTYTFVPILLYAAAPVLSILFVHRGIHMYEMKNVVLGGGALACAAPFFVLGLDDDNDPYRIFHGMWHLVGGVSAYYLWRIVRTPQAIALQSVMCADAANLLQDRKFVAKVTKESSI